MKITMRLPYFHRMKYGTIELQIIEYLQKQDMNPKILSNYSSMIPSTSNTTLFDYDVWLLFGKPPAYLVFKNDYYMVNLFLCARGYMVDFPRLGLKGLYLTDGNKLWFRNGNAWDLVKDSCSLVMSLQPF